MNIFTYTISALPEIISKLKQELKSELKSELKFTKATNREITVYCRTIDEEKILDISKKYTNEIITVSLFDEASMTTTFDYYENGEKIQTYIIEEE